MLPGQPLNGGNPTPPSGQDGQQAGAPVVPQTPPVQQPPAGNDNPNAQFVTQQQLQEAMQKLTSNSQQAVGKMEARIRAEITRSNKAGVQVTPQQAEAIIRQRDAEETAGSTLAGQTPGGQAPAQPGNVGQPAMTPAEQWAIEDGVDPKNPIILEAYKIMERAGVRMTDDDPEAQEITANTPLEFLQSVNQAVAKIKARKEAAGSASTTPGLLTGQQNNTPAHADMSASETLDLAFENLGFK